MIRVYRIPFSTNVERVALAAAHKGLEVEWIDVDPDDRSPVRELSGQELVPVLEHDGRVISDSPKILRYLEQLRPEPPLWPRERARAAEVDTFVDWFNLVWKRAPNRIYAEEGADVEKLGGHMRAALERFEALLDGREFLFGDFGVADITAFPFLKYAELGLPEGDDHRFHVILVEQQPLGPQHERLRAWIHRVDALPRA